MQIKQSSIAMNSVHARVDAQTTEEHLRVTNTRTGAVLQMDTVQSSITISGEARQMFERSQTTTPDRTPAGAGNGQTGSAQAACKDEDDNELSDKDKLKIQMIESFIESTTGKKIKLIVPKKVTLDGAAGGTGAAMTVRPGVRVGWGLTYDRTEHHIEAEQMQYQAAGTVTTADGREIRFAVDLNMQRQYESVSQVSIRAGDQPQLCDPLVMNLSGAPTSLTQQKYAFDLNGDGKEEQIAFVQPGSAFLVLDRNGNGKVDDGSELFGVASGNGFADLSAYDQDNNGWIDENDAVFDKLQLWMKDESGTDYLVALGQAGVGAIYLGSEQTEFTLKNTQNDTQGVVRRTGVYLRENGGAGTLQQIDLAL
ncbi:hypothetical protein B5M42_004370 [Paenibacillus athensensis]|uniref:VCBS repeat-containing protein n=1 Tax=Paenibacillus athensensis TaxID=1967502 RepID=A0A4Y8PYI0_9BACL|nr:hypothetical protein [Paenibacillus athensensis]MCD1258073.1 hypothetical protein [Paenibacillus athensensis]